MRRIAPLTIALCAILAIAATTHDSPPPSRSATVAVTDDGRIVAVNHDSASVTIVDGAEKHEIRVCSRTQTVVTSASRAFVACGDGLVAKIDLTTRTVERMAAAGVEPFGVALDGERLYVSDTGGAAVRVLDAGTLATLATIATEEYPRGLALHAGRLYVTHFRSGRISIIDTATNAVTRVIGSVVGANLSQAIVVDPDTNRLYVPQTRSNSANAALLFDTTVFPIVAVVNLGSESLPIDRLLIDLIDRPSNMPFDAVLTSSKKLYVVHAGSDDVSVIDAATKKKIAHIGVGSNPRGIALSPDERLAYVNNALSGTLSVIDTATDQIVSTIPLTTIALPPDVLNGKILFHTSNRTTLAKDRWISCATCHFDGSVDGRTWFFRDGPRNTTPLFDLTPTLPLHWSGDLDELQDVESTIRIVQAGSGLADGDSFCTPTCNVNPPNANRSKDLDDLAAFMVSLRPPRRLYVRTEAARRGESHFLGRAGCVSCHPAPLYTDRKTHDVGTGAGDDVERKGNRFDTPSLRGLADTAPYLHDGSAATIRDAITRHTDTGALTPPELDEIVAFLQSIPLPQPKQRAVRH